MACTIGVNLSSDHEASVLQVAVVRSRRVLSWDYDIVIHSSIRQSVLKLEYTVDVFNLRPSGVSIFKVQLHAQPS